LSERAYFIEENQVFDAKICHIHLAKAAKSIFVLLSFKADSGWRNEMREFKSKLDAPVFAKAGLAWPGDGDPTPGTPSKDLYNIFPTGFDTFEMDLWTKPLSELVVQIGPPPHVYAEAETIQGSKVWVADPSVQVKDPRRPKLFNGYRGDEKGRYNAIWLSKDKIKPILKTTIGWTGGDVWMRRNHAVLHAHWKAFKSLETWFKGEILFNYDMSDADDYFKFHAFLMIPLNPSPWMYRPSLQIFKERCVLADQRAFHRFDLPFLRSAPADDGEDEAEAEEISRSTLSGVPACYSLNWSKMKLSSKLPDARITHDGQVVQDVMKIVFPVPDDAYFAVSHSGLLNTPQLSSLYSSVGTRCHLAICFGHFTDTEGNMDIRNVVFTQTSHISENKHCPYENMPGGGLRLKSVFQQWVFEEFYQNYVKHLMDKRKDVLGTAVALELAVFHPFLITNGRVPCTFLDAIYQKPDGSLMLVDFKTLQSANPPNYIVRGSKNRLQVVTNALLFMLMTKIRVDSAALVYITRSGTLTVVELKIADCIDAMKAAALEPAGPSATNLWYRDNRWSFKELLNIPEMNEIIGTSGTAAGHSMSLPVNPAMNTGAVTLAKAVHDAAIGMPSVGSPNSLYAKLQGLPEFKDTIKIRGINIKLPPAVQRTMVSSHDEAYIRTMHRLVNLWTALEYFEPLRREHTRSQDFLASFLHKSDRAAWNEEMMAFAKGLVHLARKRCLECL